MTDQLPARAADIGNTVIHVLSGHIPSWEAIRDLVLPELRKVRQEALEEAVGHLKVMASPISKEDAITAIRGLMEKDGG